MKIREIISEDMSAEEQLGGDSLVSNLVPVLNYLKSRSEDKKLTPKIGTDNLIQLVNNAGDVTFNYESLVAAYEDIPAVKELIKSFSKEEVVLKSSEDEDTEFEFDEPDTNNMNQAVQSPEETVNGMAKKAMNKREG